MRRIRRWFKSIIAECVHELKQEQVKVIAYRKPEADDVYAVNSVWQDVKHNKLYYARKVTVKWEESDYEAKA